MIGVSFIYGTYEARWGLTGDVIYRGEDPAAMASAIEAAFQDQTARIAALRERAVKALRNSR